MTAGEIPSSGPSNASTVMTSKVPPPPIPGQSQPQSQPQIFTSQQQYPQNPVAFPQNSPSGRLDANPLNWGSPNQQTNPQQLGFPSPPLAQSQGFVPGMDQALQNVLSDFEPLFGVESGQNFWDYGNSSSSGGSGATPHGYTAGGTPTGGTGIGPPPGSAGGVAEPGGIDWSEYLRYSNRPSF